MLENWIDIKAITMESMEITYNPSKFQNLACRGECTVAQIC
jgi:TATA-box binding protein (TBP) (component of TFIID and TFIIIB)